MMRALLTALVKGYRLLFSAWLSAGDCRFFPSCSTYALQALEQHGAAAGSYLALRRIVRCQPWCAGGHDDVPAQTPRLFGLLSLPSAKKSS